MALYNYECPTHGRFEAWRPMAEYDQPEPCPHCGELSPRGVSAPRSLQADYEPYHCPITGNVISGRRAHRENLRKHNCRVFETGERENLIRTKAAAEAAFDKAIETTVEQSFDAMTSSQRESLANELTNGVTATVTRG